MAPWNPFVEVRRTDGALAALWQWKADQLTQSPPQLVSPWLLSAVPICGACHPLPCVMPPAGGAAGGATQVLGP